MTMKKSQKWFLKKALIVVITAIVVALTFYLKDHVFCFTNEVLWGANVLIAGEVAVGLGLLAMGSDTLR